MLEQGDWSHQCTPTLCMVAIDESKLARIESKRAESRTLWVLETNLQLVPLLLGSHPRLSRIGDLSRGEGELGNETCPAPVQHACTGGSLQR